MGRTMKTAIASLACLVLFSFFAIPAAASAATYYVDSVNGSDTTGNGSSGAPFKTFNKAYASSSANDTLDLTGTFDWSNAAETGDVVTTGYTIGKNLTIVGHGPTSTIIQATSSDNTGDRRVFTIATGVTANIQNLSIRYGKESGTSGGCVYSSPTSTTTLTGVDVYNCRVTYASGYGGGVDNAGIMTISNSAIYSNSSGSSGAGAMTTGSASRLYITDSTVYSNAQTNGSGGGGGLYAEYGVLTLTNSTVALNSGAFGGGISLYYAAALNLANSIIADNVGNSVSDRDFYIQSGTVISNGYNIFGYAGGSTSSSTGDWIDANSSDNDTIFTLYGSTTTGPVNLSTSGGVNDNPSMTNTVALLAGSVAINNASSTVVNNGIAAPSTDQRGATRNGNPDIGAYEYQAGGITISAPTVQGSNITFSNVQYDRMTLNWTNGNGSRHVLFMTAGTGTASPVNGTRYTASSTFGVGSQIGTSGWYAIVDDTSTSSVTVMGLTASTTYTVEDFEYNGVDSGMSQYNTSATTGNPATQSSYVPQTIYINSGTGSDTTGNGSSGNPYQTFNKGYTVANRDDTLNLTGTFDWSSALETGDAVTTGYTISKDINIVGNGAANTVIQATSSDNTGSSRIFSIASGVIVNIQNLTMRYGKVAASGACIFNNTGAILSMSYVEMYDCRQTSTSGEGGAFYMTSGTTTISNSSIYSNVSAGSGGGLALDNSTAGRFYLTNSSVYLNSQTYGGGGGAGMYIGYGSGWYTNDTFTANAGNFGGAFDIYQNSNLYFKNTIIAGNTGSATTLRDFYRSAGTITSAGYNIMGYPPTGTTNTTGDWVDANSGDADVVFTLHGSSATGTPALDSSAKINGNPYGTHTYALLSNSVAVDHGDNTSTNNGVAIPVTDQRGASRSGATDIGAYEYNGTLAADTTPPSVSITAPTSGATVSGALVSLTATSSDNIAVSGVQFYVDSTPVGSSSSTSPYTVTWNSNGVANGSHTIYAVATDTSGNQATSSVAITVSNLTYSAPGVTVSSATSIATSSATLNGSIVFDGNASSTIEGFTYGLTSSYGATTSTTGTYGVGSFSIPVSGLVCNTAYHYQAFATNSQGTGTSTDQTFMTSACPVYLISANPNSLYANSGNSGVILTGSSTFWTSGTPGSPTFQLTGGTGASIASQSISGSSSAALTINPGTTAGTLLLLDPSSGATTSIAVVTATTPTPSSISASSLSTSTATITWTTATSSDSRVNYGMTSAYGSSTYVSAQTVSHTLALSGLIAGTTYHYQVVSAGPYSNSATSSDQTFTTLPALSVPTVTVQAASAVATSSATLNGTIVFDGNASSTIRGFNYGITTAYGSAASTTGTYGIGAYSMTIAGLLPSTTYHYLAFSTNSQGTGTSSDATFTTSALAAPVISSVSVSTTTTTATITWTTDQAASSTVNYGSTTGYGSASTSAALVTSHSIVLTSLVPGATYHYQVSSANSYGTVGTSTDYTFTTASNPNYLIAASISSLYAHSGNSAVILTGSSTSWTAGTPGSPTFQLTGGTGTSIVSQAISGTTSAALTINPGTAAGTLLLLDPSTGATTTISVVLAATPTISSIATSSVSVSTATIAWNTATSSDSLINYGITSAYGSSTYASSQVSSHSVALSGLLPSTTYHYQVVSAGPYSNSATSSDQTFTTSATPDTTPPTVLVTTPTSGATVFGSAVSLSATSSDNVAVAGVTFYVDGQKKGSEITSAPYTTTWDSTATTSGTHSVFAVARDTSNNFATSSVVTFTTDNSIPSFSAITKTTSSSSVTIAWTSNVVTSSIVHFGPTASYGSTTQEVNVSPRVMSHLITLNGLPSCTSYHFELDGWSATSREATSSDQTFVTDGCTANAPVSATNADTIMTNTGGTVTEGTLSLLVPQWFTSTSTQATFEANQIDGNTFFMTIAGPASVSQVGNSVFTLKALTDATTTLSTFSVPLTVTLSYSPSDVTGLDLTTLKIYRYDDGMGWTPLTACVVDTNAHTVSCQTSHFSDFAIFGQAQSGGVGSSGSSGSGSGSGGCGTMYTTVGNTIYANTCGVTSVYQVLQSSALPSSYLASHSAASPVLYSQTGTPVSFVTSTLMPTVSSSSVSISALVAQNAVSTSSVSAINSIAPIQIRVITFMRNLTTGSSGADVLALQKYLNAHGFIIAKGGAGSPGNETNTFGSKTRAALAAYQKSNGISPAIGYFGPLTRAFISSHN